MSRGCCVDGVKKEAVAALDVAYGTLLRVADPGNLLQRSFYDKCGLPSGVPPGTWLAELHESLDMKRLFPFAGTTSDDFVHLLQHACAEAAANIVAKVLSPEAALPFPEGLALGRGTARFMEGGYFSVAAKLKDTCVSDTASLLLITTLLCSGMRTGTA
jgi:hypothetical protein